MEQQGWDRLKARVWPVASGVLLTALVVAIGWPFLNTPDPTPDDIATSWNKGIARLGLLPVFPPSEDLHVGDIWAVVVEDAADPSAPLLGKAVRVDRIGRPPLQIERATLTIGLAVQPDVLRGLPEKPAFRGRGLLARFWYCVPVSKVGRRTIEPAPLSDATRSAYADHLRALLAIGPPVAEEGRSRANVLPLTNEAHDLIVAFQTELEPRLAPIGDLGHIADWAGKLTGPVLRVAGLLHCAAHATDLLWREPVSGRTISAAINVGHYLLGHAVAAFARMGASADIEGARRCLAWALTRDLTTFSKRDLFEGLKGRYERVEMLDGPLRVLIERGYIRPEPAPPSRGPGRPPSPVYAVNPLARCGAGGSQNSHYSHKGAGEALSHPVGDSRNSQNVGAGWEEVDDDAD